MIGAVKNSLDTFTLSFKKYFDQIPLERTTKLALICLTTVPFVYCLYKLFGRVNTIPKELPNLANTKRELPKAEVKREEVKEEVKPETVHAEVVEEPIKPEEVREEESEQAFVNTAEKGDVVACLVLLWFYRNDPQKFFNYQKKAADLGDVESQICMGRACLKEGTAEGQENAMSYFLNAHKTGHAEASFQIGLLWSKGWSDRKPDLKKAKEYFELAAEKGYGDAVLELKEKEAEKPAKTSLKKANQDALRKKREEKQLAEGKENAVPTLPAKTQVNRGQRRALTQLANS